MGKRRRFGTPITVIPIPSMAKRRCFGAMGVLPYDIVWEILQWLPTKSLMRFKAVSKLWLSVILDPNFARAHRAPFRGLLLTNSDPSLVDAVPALTQPAREFFIANLDEKSSHTNELNFSLQFSIPGDLRSFRTSNIVNGIICFYDHNVTKLCNIATHEIINLPESKFNYMYCNYHLGFDPIQNVYKLLKICPFFDSRKNSWVDTYRVDRIECEILTLGVDSSWRFINPPTYCFLPHGLCIDGVLYWMGAVPGTCPRGFWPLSSFNVAEEKFQSISYPKGYDPFLLQSGTNLALSKYKFDKPEKIMMTYYREGSWSEFVNYIVNYDYNIKSLDYVRVQEWLPNGNLMMYEDIVAPSTDTPIYLFDPTRNIYLQKFTFKFPASFLKLHGREIGGGICLFELHGKISWYEENIISLKRLTGF